MMKLIERLDQHMSVKTWVPNSAARSASMTPGLTSRESLSRHPSTTNLHQLRRQPSIDEKRKLKQERLAELTRQLELTQLQNDPPPPHPVPQASRPRSPVETLLPEPLCPPVNDVDLEWQERLRKAEEINTRIEYLRSTGLPPDRIPSPVLLPSRSGSQAPMDRVHLNSTFPRDYRTPPPLSPPNDPRLRHQPSKRSLNSTSSSHPMKSPPSVGFQKNHTPTKDRSVSSSQVGYYQALKEAENLIGKLRKSHDDLLERANDLEKQLNLKEDENRNLMARNQRLEDFLADEQKIKEGFKIENERLMDQLKSLSSSSQASSNHQNHQAQTQHSRAKFQASKSHQESAYDSFQSELGQRYQNPSSARAELFRREENLLRQYAYNYSIPTIRPEPIQPGSNLRSKISPHPSPVQKSNTASSNNSKYPSGHEPVKSAYAFRFPSNSQPPNRDPDSVNQDSYLTNNSNSMNAYSANHASKFGSSGLDNVPRPSHDLQEPSPHPMPQQFMSHNHLHHPFNDELPLPPFMNEQLAGNYLNPPGNLRPQPFPTYGYY